MRAAPRHRGGMAVAASTAIPLRTVLLAPGVARVFAASLVGRLPAGALGLLLIRRTRELGGSFGAGGLAAGAFSLGLAVSAPAIGRAVDARGQTRVLAVCAAAVAGALIALALLPSRAPLGAVLALAVLAGIAHPPLSACLRALWPHLLPDPSRQHAAYALEAAALEVSYVLGPLVLVSVVATRSAALALALCAALLLAGTPAFAAHPASRGSPAGGGRAGGAAPGPPRRDGGRRRGARPRPHAARPRAALRPRRSGDRAALRRHVRTGRRRGSRGHDHGGVHVAGDRHRGRPGYRLGRGRRSGRPPRRGRGVPGRGRRGGRRGHPHAVAGAGPASPLRAVIA